MNRICKFFVGISIVLTIALVIITCLYFKAVKIGKENLNNVLDNAELLFKTNLAIENAGYRIQLQENGSFILVERITE